MARTTPKPNKGCVVTGKISKIDGTPNRTKISIIPTKQGFFNGTFYSSDTITIIPNETGEFSITLPPSSVAGVYTVVINGKRIPLEIKDNETEKRLDGS